MIYPYFYFRRHHIFYVEFYLQLFYIYDYLLFTFAYRCNYVYWKSFTICKEELCLVKSCWTFLPLLSYLTVLLVQFQLSLDFFTENCLMTWTRLWFRRWLMRYQFLKLGYLFAWKNVVCEAFTFLRLKYLVLKDSLIYTNVIKKNPLPNDKKEKVQLVRNKKIILTKDISTKDLSS